MSKKLLKYILPLVYLFVSQYSNGQVLNDFRSFATGSWNIPANWERFNGTVWVLASYSPGSGVTANVTVQTGHSMNLTANAAQNILTLTINSGATVTVGAFNLTIDGVTNVNGTFSDNNPGGTTSFGGLVTLGATGTWTNVGGVFQFGGGLQALSTFNSGTGTYTFGINPQTITPGANMTFSTAIGIGSNVTIASGSPVSITGNITMTASATLTNLNANLSIGGALNGSSINNTFTNGTGGYVKYSNSAMPMSIGSMNCIAINNTFEYAGNGIQTIRPDTYYHLTISGIGTFAKTIGASATTTMQVNGDFVYSASNTMILNLGNSISQMIVNGNSTLSGGSIIYSNTILQLLRLQGDVSFGTSIINMTGNGSLQHVLDLKGTSNTGAPAFNTTNFNIIDYSRTGDQSMVASLDYPRLTISGSGTKTLANNSRVKENLIVQSGCKLDLGTTTTLFNVMGISTIDGNIGYGSTTQTIILDGDLLGSTGGSTIDLSAGGLPHILTLKGASNASYAGTFITASGTEVQYDRNSTQDVKSGTYYKVAFTTPGGLSTKNTSGFIDVREQLRIGGNANLTVLSALHEIYCWGNWINDGIFTPGTSRVVFNGSTISQISGTSNTSFYNLAINNSASVQVLKPFSAVSTNIHTNCTIDLGNLSGSNFGAADGQTGGGTAGLIRISALPLGTAQFPDGNFSAYMSDQGTIEYYSNNSYSIGAIPAPASVPGYYHVIFSEGGIKTLNSSATVLGHAYLYAGTTVAANADLHLQGNIYANTGATYNASNAQNTFFENVGTDQTIIGPGNYTFGTLTIAKNASSDLILNVPITINTKLEWTADGRLNLGPNDLIIGPNATFNTVSGLYSGTRMINISSTGMLQKEANSIGDFVRLYPFGSGYTYSPLDIQPFTATVTGPSPNIRLRPVDDNTCTNCVSLYMETAVNNLNITGVNFRFYVPASELLPLGVHPTKVIRDNGAITTYSSPDTSTTVDPIYYGYTGASAFDGKWQFLSGNPVITDVQVGGISTTSLCTGQAFDILGDNFIAGTTAAIGGFPITINSITGTSPNMVIHAVAPTIVTGSLSVNNTIASITYIPSITVNGTPTALAGPDIFACSYQSSIPLNGNAVASAVYNWTTNGFGTLAGPTNNISAYSPNITELAGAAIQAVYQVTLGACIDKDTVIINLNPAPSGNTILSSASPVCQGGTISGFISGTPIGGGTNFLWISSTTSSGSGFSPAAPANNLQNYNFPATPSVTTWYKRIAIDGSSGCVDTSAHVQVDILPKPTGGIITPSSGNTCIGNSQVFNISSVIGTVTSYTWSVTAGGTLSGPAPSGPTATVNFTSSGLVTISATPKNGSCAASTSLTSTFTVNPSPNITTPATTRTACSGQTGNVNILLNADIGPVTYNWTVILGGTVTGANPGSGGSINQTLSGLGTINYSVQATSGAGCQSALILFPVNVIAPPSNTIIYTPNQDTVCNGQTAIINLSGTQNGVSYMAYSAGGKIDSVLNLTGSTLSLSLPYNSANLFTGPTVVTLKAGIAGCTSVTFGTTTIYKSNLTPFSISSMGSTVLCGSPSVPSLVSSYPATPGSHYQWYKDGYPLVGDSLQSTSTYVVGTYTQQVTDQYKCASTSTNSININYGSLQPIISMVTSSSAEVHLSSNAVPGTYQWYAMVGGVLKRIQGQNGSDYYAYFDGDYYLATQNNNCLIFSSPYSVTGMLAGALLKQNLNGTDSSIVIPNIDFSQEIQLYPNPNTGSFTVKYIAGSVTGLHLELYNSMGGLVFSKYLDVSGYLDTRIEDLQLPKGIYTFKLNDGIRTLSRIVLIDPQ